MVRSEIQNVKLRFGIIGNSEGLNRAIDIAIQVAPTDLSVLITGESGVGKENFPQIIHQFSRRKHGQYIAVNCGAIPEGTIDSELFGHEKGAFTGAISDRKGYFAEADGEQSFWMKWVSCLYLLRLVCCVCSKAENILKSVRRKYRKRMCALWLLQMLI